MNKKETARNREEIELYQSKFFDYRPVSPDVATMQFMYAYGKAMEIYNDTLGYTKYRHILKAFDKMELGALKEKTQFKSLASLRRWADRHGMPYDLYWSYATEAHLQLKFDKTYINVFSHKKIRAYVLEKWESRRRQVVIRSDSHFFKAENYQGFQVQKDYYEYVIDGVFEKHNYRDAGYKLADLVRAGELDEVFVTNHVRKMGQRENA